VEAGSSPSIQVPRRQPRAIPASVPMTKLITVAAPIRPIVHGSVWAITVLTGTDSEIDTPRLPRSSWPQ
jgi:hypothetical protein